MPGWRTTSTTSTSPRGAPTDHRASKTSSATPAPDLLERDFTAVRSDQRWVEDVTEFACWDAKLFLAGIKDLHDQGLAGWSMGERNNTDLVVNALVMALARRQPGTDLVHHADRGSTYTSLEFSNRLRDWKINPSFSSTGDCYDCEHDWVAARRV